MELQAQMPGDATSAVLKGTPSPKAHHPLLKQAHATRQVQVKIPNE
jgi:hypothetical protein